jgi:hypothetical protein
VQAAADPQRPNRRPATTFPPPQLAIIHNFEGAKLERSGKAEGCQLQTKFCNGYWVQTFAVQSGIHGLIFHVAVDFNLEQFKQNAGDVADRKQVKFKIINCYLLNIQGVP